MKLGSTLSSLTILQVFLWPCDSDMGCQMMLQDLSDCYRMIDITVPRVDDASFLELVVDYIDSCRFRDKFSVFMDCYSKLFLVCPQYEQFVPNLLDMVSVRALLNGLCDHSEEYMTGLECMWNTSQKFPVYTSRCFADRYARLLMEASKSGDWKPYCDNVYNEYRCLAIVIEAFRCDKNFLPVVRHMSFSIQPRHCRNLTDESYDWIVRYGLRGNVQMAAYDGVLMILALLSVMYFGFFV